MGKLYLGTQEIGAAYAPNITSPEVYIPLAVNAISNTLEKPTTSFTWSAPSTAYIIGDHALLEAFYNSGITSADFNNVTTINDRGLGYAFRGCTSLTTVSFDNVSSIGPSGLIYAFEGCTSLTTLSFPALTTSSFGTSTNQFNGMLNGCTGVTVHFPTAIASTIGSWSSVRNGFGGTNTTVLFDL